MNFSSVSRSPHHLLAPLCLGLMRGGSTIYPERPMKSRGRGLLPCKSKVGTREPTSTSMILYFAKSDIRNVQIALSHRPYIFKLNPNQTISSSTYNLIYYADRPRPDTSRPSQGYLAPQHQKSIRTPLVQGGVRVRSITENPHKMLKLISATPSVSDAPFLSRGNIY